MILQNQPWLYSLLTAEELPVGLSHIDSELCWCDPIIDIDSEDSTEILLHRQVTWN